jgi:hypothetical protein
MRHLILDLVYCSYLDKRICTMVFTKKFSEFTVADLSDSGTQSVGLTNGANSRTPKFLIWTTAGRPAAPFTGILGYNSDLVSYEFWDGAAWTQFEDSTDIATLLALLASHAVAEGASLIGLEDQGSVSNKTVQDMANAQFIVQVNNGSLANAQSMGSLTTGIVKSTTGTGVQSISAPLTSIDGLTTVANNMIYTTGANVYTVLAPVNSGVLASSAAGVPTWLGPMTDGQIIIGSTGAVPVRASLTAGSGVTITPGAGSISIAATGSGGTVTSIAAGSGIVATPDPIIGSGTIALNTAAMPAFTMAAAIAMGGFGITGLLDPVANQDAATKNYVDQTAQGRVFKDPVVAATTADFSATYANGASGVGATLTGTVMAAFAPDGVTLAVGDRVLFKDQTDTFENGIYTTTVLGDGATLPVFTRAVDMDKASEFLYATMLILGGTTQAGQTWTETATVVTVGTDPVVFVQTGDASSVISLTAGTGLTASPNPVTGTGTISATGALLDIANNVIGPNKNLVIGGNFDTNPWQRGVSFAGLTAGANSYSADRFRVQITSTSGVISVLKTADAPTVAEAGIFSSNCLHVDVTTADAVVDAGDLCTFSYRMEGYDWAQIAQRAFTLSFWVKAAKTGIHSVGLINSGEDRAYIAEYTVNVADTWEKKTITVPASPSAGTWNYTTGVGIEIRFILMAGSTYFDTVGSWVAATGNSRASANQVNELDNTANNFKLALVQVEAGSNATGFEVRPFEEELDLCLRYYQTWGGTNSDENIGVGLVNTTAQASIALPFQKPMRVVPALSVSSAAHFNVQYQNSNSTATSIAFGSNSAGLKSGNVQVAPTGTPLTVGDGVKLKANTTSARLNLDAEL